MPSILSAISAKFAEWKREQGLRIERSSRDRAPFYDLAGKYLPEDNDEIVLDIGVGEGSFPDRLELADKYDKLYLLDGNEKTVGQLVERYRNAVLWRVGDRMPLEDGTVGFVHCSHMIEHLTPDQLYGLVMEVDRVLRKGGVMVISAPLMWEGFYGSLTHVKPYYPQVLISYLSQRHGNPTKERVSSGYTQLELVYRYREMEPEEGAFWGSRSPVAEIVLQAAKRIMYRLGFRKYQRSGYTLVMRKEQ